MVLNIILTDFPVLWVGLRVIEYARKNVGASLISNHKYLTCWIFILWEILLCKGINMHALWLSRGTKQFPIIKLADWRQKYYSPLACAVTCKLHVHAIFMTSSKPISVCPWIFGKKLIQIPLSSFLLAHHPFDSRFKAVTMSWILGETIIYIYKMQVCIKTV